MQNSMFGIAIRNRQITNTYNEQQRKYRPQTADERNTYKRIIQTWTYTLSKLLQDNYCLLLFNVL